jgi:hypothetical protein
MWRRVGIVQTYISEERVASIFRARETTQAKKSVRRLLTDIFFARVISSTLKMEATRSSETSVYNIPTGRHIPEDGILHSHRHENLKSYILIIVYQELNGPLLQLQVL